MSDDFIPFNQSTPLQSKWQGNNHHQRSFHHNRSQNGQGQRWGGHNKWGNNARRSVSFGSDGNNSFGQDKQTNIDAYLHPSMLEDPWDKLRNRST